MSTAQRQISPSSEEGSASPIFSLTMTIEEKKRKEPHPASPASSAFSRRHGCGGPSSKRSTIAPDPTTLTRKSSSSLAVKVPSTDLVLHPSTGNVLSKYVLPHVQLELTHRALNAGFISRISRPLQVSISRYSSDTTNTTRLHDTRPHPTSLSSHRRAV